MENIMSTQKYTKLAKGILLAAALVTSVIACGKKNQDNNQNINAFTQSCVNCQNITGFPFFTAQTRAYKMNYSGYGYGGYAEAFKINWSFSGQNVSSQTQASNPYGQTYGSPAMTYSGQVSAAGQVTVTTPINFGFCPAIPPGAYNLTTQTVGQWNGGQISGLKLLITGAVNMTAIFTQGQASEGGYGYAAGSFISGNMIIEQVNGYYCQGANLYLGNW
jgi:hypothetical protein